jgi:thiol-disulfide isomerase/thioredoxin
MIPARTLAGLRSLAVAAVLALVAAGCASPSGAGGGSAAAGDRQQGGASADGTGYVGGDGSVTVVPAAERVAAPALSGPRLGGGEVSLAELRGNVVVLNVWGSWCPPCRAEAPTLERVAADLRPEGVRFLGINVRDNDDAARAFEREYDISYPSLVDRDNRALLQFRDTLPPTAIPSTIVVDQQGRVAARALGPVTEQRLRGMIDAVLSGAG